MQDHFTRQEQLEREAHISRSEEASALRAALDGVGENLGAKLDRMEAKLSEKLDQMGQSLGGKLDQMEQSLGGKLDRMEVSLLAMGASVGTQIKENGEVGNSKLSEVRCT